MTPNAVGSMSFRRNLRSRVRNFYAFEWKAPSFAFNIREAQQGYFETRPTDT